MVLAGRGAEGERLRLLAHDLDIEKHVTFTGFVPDDMLPSVYASASCFVNACTAELQCIALLEAMATGLPAIGANAVALPELIHTGENGYLFTPGDVDELAKAMIRMFADTVRMKQMSEQSLKIVAHHDIRNILTSFEDFYRATLEKNTKQ